MSLMGEKNNNLNDIIMPIIFRPTGLTALEIINKLMR